MADSETRYHAQRFAFSRALALAGITITLSIPIAFYARASAPDTTMVPLISNDGRGFYLASIFVVAIISAIIQALETDDPARIVNRYGERLYQFRMPAPRTAWMLPAVSLFSLYLAVALENRLIVVVAVPFAAGVVVLAARMVRFEVLNRVAEGAEIAPLLLQVLVYFTAAGALLVVFEFRARALYAGPLVCVMMFLLLMTLFDGLDSSAFQRALYAAIGALAVGQVYWALGFWNVSTLIGAALLWLVFLFYGSVSRTLQEAGINQQQVAARAGFAIPLFLLFAYLVE